MKFPETTVAGEPITSYAPDLAGRAGLPGARAGSDRAMTVAPPRPARGRSVPATARSGAAGQDGRRPFHVRLANFDGPFDLLLQLINQRRMDVTEVALHQVTDDFIAHIRAHGHELGSGPGHRVPGRSRRPCWT